MKVRLSLSERSHTIGSGDDDEDIYGVQRQACFFSLAAFLSMKEKDEGEGGGKGGMGREVEWRDQGCRLAGMAVQCQECTGGQLAAGCDG